MLALTPSERRGALVLVVLLLIGAAHDLWRARDPAAERAAAAREGPAAAAETQPRPADADPDAPESARADGAPDSSRPAPPQPPARPPRRGPVDLNRAPARELDALPGIGPVLAERIVLQRRRYGPFTGIDELLAVRGVGPRLLERIRPWATVGPVPGPGRAHGVAAAPDSAPNPGR
jgi:competence protein ComEA